MLFSCYFKNKMNLCKSIFLWYIGRIIDSYTTCSWICFASNVYYSCSRVAEFLAYNDSFRDIPEEAFFPDWALYQFFPSFYCFHFLPCLMLTRAIKGYFVAFGVVHEPLPTQRVFLLLKQNIQT